MPLIRSNPLPLIDSDGLSYRGCSATHRDAIHTDIHTQGISCVVRGVVSFRLLGVVKVNVAWLMAIWGVN